MPFNFSQFIFVIYHVVQFHFGICQILRPTPLTSSNWKVYQRISWKIQKCMLYVLIYPCHDDMMCAIMTCTHIWPLTTTKGYFVPKACFNVQRFCTHVINIHFVFCWLPFLMKISDFVSWSSSGIFSGGYKCSCPTPAWLGSLLSQSNGVNSGAAELYNRRVENDGIHSPWKLNV